MPGSSDRRNVAWLTPRMREEEAKLEAAEKRRRWTERPPRERDRRQVLERGKKNEPGVAGFQPYFFPDELMFMFI